MRRVCLVVVAVTALPVALAAAASETVRMTARPVETLLDERVAISVSGLRPHERVTIRAATRSADRREWRASAVFRADMRGRVRVASARSLGGTYRGRDPMGLFWSLTPVGRSTVWSYVPTDEARVTLATIARGRVVARTQVRRWRRSPRSEQLDLTLQDPGVVGRFTVPQTVRSAPAVMYLGGSEGGVPSGRVGGILAARGFPTLELAYFRAPGLPPTLTAIRLEYFVAALEWLASRPEVDGQRIVVFGVSRGAEAALLLGASYPELVAGVIAYVPSSIVNPSPGGDAPAWTRGGVSVPYVSGDDIGDPSPRNEAAIIPVERIRGPVLLVSGAQDDVWPSALFADAIVRRRAASGKPTTSLSFLGAGHAVGAAVPNVPAFPGGGSRAADAAARARAWPHVLELLRSLRTASSR